jgi:hypothetical protein
MKGGGVCTAGHLGGAIVQWLLLPKTQDIALVTVAYCQVLWSIDINFAPLTRGRYDERKRGREEERNQRGIITCFLLEYETTY